jgi:hypothetical protein
MESIGAIVKGKTNSPLNKANGALCVFGWGLSTDSLFSFWLMNSEFVRKLQTLDADNSKGEVHLFFPFFLRHVNADGRIHFQELDAKITVLPNPVSIMGCVLPPSPYTRPASTPHLSLSKKCSLPGLRRPFLFQNALLPPSASYRRVFS